MPARKIPRSYVSVTGRFPSRKSIGRAEFESMLEADLLTLLEFDPLVERFETQPVTIRYEDADGKARRYTPDVLIHFRAATELGCAPTPLLVEVKPREVLRAKWAEIRPKLRVAQAFARLNGWRVGVRTERHIRGPFLDNARFLLSYAHADADPESEHLVRDRLEIMRSASAAELLAAACWDPSNRALVLPSLWRLVATREILCDLHRPLTMSSRLWALDE
jgi:hypothetical protein